MVAVAVAASFRSQAEPAPNPSSAHTGEIQLPAPDRVGTLTFERLLASRRSVRAFRATPLSMAVVSQLLWAAQGITDAEGRRTAPSAGALFPLDVYVAMADGAFHYLPRGHRLEHRSDRDLRPLLARAAFGQDAVREAPAVFAITAVWARTESKYDGRARLYVPVEVGHAAQNLLLQATALRLAGVPVGAFDEDAVHAALGLASGEAPLYLVPIGEPAAPESVGCRS